MVHRAISQALLPCRMLLQGKAMKEYQEAKFIYDLADHLLVLNTKGDFINQGIIERAAMLESMKPISFELSQLANAKEATREFYRRSYDVLKYIDVTHFNKGVKIVKDKRAAAQDQEARPPKRKRSGEVEENVISIDDEEEKQELKPSDQEERPSDQDHQYCDEDDWKEIIAKYEKMYKKYNEINEAKGKDKRGRKPKWVLIYKQYIDDEPDKQHTMKQLMELKEYISEGESWIEKNK